LSITIKARKKNHYDEQQPAPNTRYKQAGQLVQFVNSLYLIHLFFTERLRIFNPSLRVARER